LGGFQYFKTILEASGIFKMVLEASGKRNLNFHSGSKFRSRQTRFGIVWHLSRDFKTVLVINMSQLSKMSLFLLCI